MCTENGMKQLYVMIERVLGARAPENNTSVFPSVGFGTAFALFCHFATVWDYVPCFATLPPCKTMCLVLPLCHSVGLCALFCHFATV